MSDPAGPSASSADRRRWPAYWVCVSVAGLTSLDTSKINVALPSIEQSLGATSTELQLTVSGYMLAFGLSLVPSGRLGDLGLRKRFFVIGLALFVVASLACALATSGVFLSGARFAQGLAAGLLMPQILGFIQHQFHGAERARAFGVLGVMLGVGGALGPTLGGVLIALGGGIDGWRGIFWINLPFGLIALLLAAWILPRDVRPVNRTVNLDLIGTAIFGCTVIALMIPFLLTTGSPEDNPLRWWLLVPFVLGGAAFVAWERRYQRTGRIPLVPLRLFRVPSFRNGTFLASAVYAALMAGVLLTTLYVQESLGIAAVFAGMVSIGYAAASAVTSWLGGRLISRFGRPVVVIGIGIAMTGFALLVVAAIATPVAIAPWTMAAALTLAGIGVGFIIPPNQSLMLEEIPADRGGIAGSVSQLGQRVGSAIGVAVALSMYYSTITRSSGTADRLTVYHDAFAFGMLSVLVFLALAFAIGVIDLGFRRRRRPTP